MQRKNIGHSIFPTHNGVLSHVVTSIVAVSFVIYSSTTEKKNNESILEKYMETIVRFLNLFTFATWVGVQFWVHVSGFTMYKTLTKTAFAQVQSKCFPLYFMTGTITSSISLASHVYINPVKSWSEDYLSIYQALGLLVSLLCSLLNFLYLGPETIRLVQIRAQRVKFLGIQDGVGPISPKLVDHDETFREIKSKFIRNHAACSLVNVICYAACGINIWCLARKQLLL